VLATLKERDLRTEALENDNRRLRKEVEELRERVVLLEKQKDDYERVEAQTDENTAELADLDVELADMREDICELKAKAASVERGELAEDVKHDVLEYMRVRLFEE
jgi:predicted  nucleic acid-binding Zn-ribbon protein